VGYPTSHKTATGIAYQIRRLRGLQTPRPPDLRPQSHDLFHERVWRVIVNHCLKFIYFRTATWFTEAEAEVTLRLTVSQSVRLGVEPTAKLATRYLLYLKVAVLSLWGALSDERSGLSLVSHCQQYFFIVKFFVFFLHVTRFLHIYILVYIYIYTQA
jgi:hypothetical protein